MSEIKKILYFVVLIFFGMLLVFTIYFLGIKSRNMEYEPISQDEDVSFMRHLHSLGIKTGHNIWMYRAGCFGGLPVVLDERFGSITNNSLISSRHRSRAKNFDFDNPIYSIYYHHQYTNNKIFADYYSDFSDIIGEHYRESNFSHNHAWVDVYFVNLSQPYAFFVAENQNQYANDIMNKQQSESSLNFPMYIYDINYNKNDLKRYVPSKKYKEYKEDKMKKDGYFILESKTEFYLSKDALGNYTDVIRCDYPKNETSKCTLHFNHKMRGYISASVKFHPAQLPHWKEIKYKSLNYIDDFVVKSDKLYDFGVKCGKQEEQQAVS